MKIHWAAVCLLPLLFPLGSTPAQLTYSTEKIGAAYTVSDDDLLQTSLSSASSGTALLYDGAFGSASNDFSGGVFLANTTITFQLDLAASPDGYDIGRINTYTGWDEGRDGQQYTLSYSLASAPSTFFTLISVGPFPEGTGFGGPYSSVRIEIYDETNPVLLSGVAGLRFQYGSFENGDTFYREIDVLSATAVPEPAHYGIALAILISGIAMIRQGRQARRGSCADTR